VSNVSDSLFPIPLSPPFEPWRNLIFEEDEGLRIALSGYFVGANSGQKIGVPFLWENPQREMDPQNRPATMGNKRSVAELTYPNIKCGFMHFDIDHEREHRNFNQITQYEPNSGNLLGTTATIDMPIPLYLYYQISANATNMQHVRQLSAMLTFQVLMPRFGVLMCPSGTVRRLDVLSGPREVRQTDANQKRFFRHIWIIRVSSEIEYSSVAGTAVGEALLSVTNTTDSDVATQTDTFTVTAS
jgi:hypothetical protein